MLAGTEATQLLKPGGEVIFEVVRSGDGFRASICTGVWPNTLVRDDDAMQRKGICFQLLRWPQSDV